MSGIKNTLPAPVSGPVMVGPRGADTPRGPVPLLHLALKRTVANRNLFYRFDPLPPELTGVPVAQTLLASLPLPHQVRLATVNSDVRDVLVGAMPPEVHDATADVWRHALDAAPEQEARLGLVRNALSQEQAWAAAQA